MIKPKLDYRKITNQSVLAYIDHLSDNIVEAIYNTHCNNDMSTIKGRCIEISRYLCDKINEVEPESAIVVCCRGFWRDERYGENDLHAYQTHQFVKYKDWYIDLTLKQFDNELPNTYISKTHLGCNQRLHQTYPEITDLNYKNNLNI